MNNMKTNLILMLLGSSPAFGQYNIPWHTIDAGGGTSAGDGYDLAATIGQPDAGETMTGGTFELTGGFWSDDTSPAETVTIVSAASCLLHAADQPNEAEWCIDFADSNGVEPRAGGPAKLRFEMSDNMDAATVTPGNVQMVCANQSPTGVSASLEGGDTVVVTWNTDDTVFDDCCTIGFDGMLSLSGDAIADTSSITTLRGDTDFSGGVTGGDAARIKPFFGQLLGEEMVTPELDYDRNGGITGGDYALIKPHFGRVAPACP